MMFKAPERLLLTDLETAGAVSDGRKGKEGIFMLLGQMLVSRGLIDHEQLDAAVERQRKAGGRVEDHLVALGFVTRDDLNAIIHEPPPVPLSIQDTGLDAQLLTTLVLKAMYVLGCQTVHEIAHELKLSRGIVETLLETVKKEGAVEVRGTASPSAAILRYALTGIGRERASEAIKQSQYVGPAPVSLPQYRYQVQKQGVTNERITTELLTRALSHLVLSPQIFQQLGPAINSGKPILLYGSSGNGKTSIAEAIGRTFQQIVYLPYCVEVSGHIIKVFDPTVHEEIIASPSAHGSDANAISLRPAAFDPRWVQCRRPVIVAGGELTLETLDLKFDSISNDYEAPLQMKASGGIFVIDDFGRQLVSPKDLLNRWIIPLEKRIDYLTLHTGQKFDVPFDEVVVFSTNLSPNDLMDTAFLRRIHYKFLIDAPTLEDYTTIFRRMCTLYNLDLPEEVLSYIVNDFYAQTRTPLAAFHAKFIVEHVIAACNYEGVAPRLTLNFVKDALQHLLIVEPGEHGSN